MPLEKQVVSLELAKELKELGYPQESLFYWSIPLVDKATTKEQEELLKNCKTELYYRDNDWGEHFESVSAPTVAELGEMLPTVFYNEHYLYCEKLEDGWLVSYKSEDRDGTYTWSPSGKKAEVAAETEADARASLLQYLLENNIIKHNEIN